MAAFCRTLNQINGPGPLLVDFQKQLDASQEKKLQVNFNVTHYHLPCRADGQNY